MHWARLLTPTATDGIRQARVMLQVEHTQLSLEQSKCLVGLQAGIRLIVIQVLLGRHTKHLQQYSVVGALHCGHSKNSMADCLERHSEANSNPEDPPTEAEGAADAEDWEAQPKKKKINEPQEWKLSHPCQCSISRTLLLVFNQSSSESQQQTIITAM
jgi:hypothetical protein